VKEERRTGGAQSPGWLAGWLAICVWSGCCVPCRLVSSRTSHSFLSVCLSVCLLSLVRVLMD